MITGQDAEQDSVQSILDGRQSMTVFNDVRTQVQTTIDTTLALLKGEAPKTQVTYNNGAYDVPTVQSPVISIERNNAQSVLIDSGYYKTGDLPGGGIAPAGARNPVVGIVLPTSQEPRWLQDRARFQQAFKAAGYDAEIIFSEGDAAQEKANVESLLKKGIKVLIICPKGAGEIVLEVKNWNAYDRPLAGISSSR